MTVSPKVSAATVGATFTTIITGIIGPHLFPHGMPADVQGLIAGVVTAAVTFGAGFLAREAKPAVAEVEHVAKAVDTVYTRVAQSAPPVEAVAHALEAEAAHVVLPVAQALPQA